jgi:hypothetical protein
LEELQRPIHGLDQNGSVGRRVVPLCVVPTFLLGLTYFLLVEYALKQQPDLLPSATLLRFGGAGVVLLFTLASLACAVQLTDGVTRPLRALLRVAEGAEIGSAQSASFPGADAEMRYLFLRVHTLVQQNRSGAQAVLELDALQREVEGLARRFRQAQQSPHPPELPIARPDSPASRLAHEAERYGRHVAARLGKIESELEEIGGMIAEHEKDSLEARREAEAAVADLEKLATVWSLEMELARRELPLDGVLGSRFEAVRTLMARLRAAQRTQTRNDDAWGEAGGAIRSLRLSLNDDPKPRDNESSDTQGAAVSSALEGGEG